MTKGALVNEMERKLEGLEGKLRDLEEEKGDRVGSQLLIKVKSL